MALIIFLFHITTIAMLVVLSLTKVYSVLNRRVDTHVNTYVSTHVHTPVNTHANTHVNAPVHAHINTHVDYSLPTHRFSRTQAAT